MEGQGALRAAWAAVPIATLLALMLGLRWSAARAGVAGLAVAAALALTVFAPAPAPQADLRRFAGVLAEGAFTCATILWILWPALALHHLQQRSGAFEALRAAFTRLGGERLPQVLLVGWFAALFFEGAAGFGTPVALAAPLLAGLGIPAVHAVVLALLGHAAGVSFGALGTPVLTQAALTGLDAVRIAGYTALLHAGLGGVLMAFFVRELLAAGGAPQGRSRAAGWAALAAALFLVPCLLLAWWLGPELATLGAALGGGLVFVAALRASRAPAPPASDGAAAGGLVRALWPYAVLVLVVLLTRALPPVRELVGQVVLQWRWQEAFQGRMQPLAHPGTMLFIALVGGALLQRRFGQVGGALAAAARQLLPVTVALLAMLCLSRLMLHAGMVGALEQAAVRLFGGAWPAAAPAVGALGSFVTGSATASNVLFTTLQVQAAQALGLPVLVLVAAQCFGAAIGNVVCPHNVVAGAATVGLAGREADILRRTVLPAAVYLLLGGVAVLWLAGRVAA